MSKELFQKWAKSYESDIRKNQNEYPFQGYFDIINILSDKIKENQHILDLGIGTGFMISELLKKRKFNFVGLDFSTKMIEYAKSNLASNEIYLVDLSVDPLPRNIHNMKFDIILAAFTLHHFPDDKKIEIIKRYSSLLKKEGSLLIADISFESMIVKLSQKLKYKKKWDSSEEKGYFISSTFCSKVRNNGINISYSKVSPCTAIYQLKF